ncbi:hypothetical protein H0O00_02075 [Candidatus Micrarchaeota archaeon]|nr:hypothetical protein [Candidatus Micrarchaeota archaeon]
MPLNIVADFFNIINIPLFDTMSVVLIVSFIIWELPRSIKIISEEYTKGIYPETGRVVDFFLLFLGLLSIGYLMAGRNAANIVAFLKTPGITSFFLILMVTLSLLVILAYFKRFFGRMDSHTSITVFLVHSFLDLMHSLFHLALVILLSPALGYVIFKGL